jgi:hypothetical protein
METLAFTLQAAEKFGPEPSLVPLFVEALETGQQGGTDPQDVFKSTLLKSSPELARRILDGWENASRSKRPRTAAPTQQAVRYANDSRSWEERVRARTAEYTAYHAAIKGYKRSLIRAEVRRALEVGVQNWTPSDSVRANKSLLYEVSRAVWGEFTVGVCETVGVDVEPTSPVYGVRFSRIRCRDKDEVGHDEVYVVSIAVDGGGTLKADTSPKYSMNDSDDNVKYPVRFIYPPTDPKGFLDIAIELWEDDGGYDDAVKAIAGLAAAVAAAGAASKNPYVIGAGVALGLIAGLVGIAGLFDHNDRYGQEGLSWLTDADLAAGVGPYTKTFVNKDEGILDFTQWNYDLQFDLILASS